VDAAGRCSVGLKRLTRIPALLEVGPSFAPVVTWRLLKAVV